MSTNPLDALRIQRAAYRKVAAALPWFDACYCPDDKPAWPEYAHAAIIDSVPIEAVHPDAIGTLQQLRRNAGSFLLRYSIQESGHAEKLDALWAEMSAHKIPLLVEHTALDWDAIAALAARHTDLPVIVASGPDRKILYHFDTLRRLMAEHPNLHLCTFNLCNWLGLERLCADGWESRLIFGTHRPRFNSAAAMAPLMFAKLPWAIKCAIAGNNLRRLFALEPVHPPEIPLPDVPPYIVDAHAHCINPGRPSPLAFFTPDVEFHPSDWIAQMDRLAIERTFLMPMESLVMPAARSCREYFAPYASHAPERFAYLERFDPREGQKHIQQVDIALNDPSCVGVKLHPPMHQTSADDPLYDAIWELAQRRKASLLTHSWEISSYNPAQELSHPSRFRRHLERYPDVRLILAHAGGRPSAMEAVAKLAQQFPNVAVDLSGDYFDTGLVEKLVDAVGIHRILFGSDVNWITPPSILGPVLASQLSDEDALRILRSNAATWFARRP